MEIARVLLASQKQGRWQQKQPKMLLTSPEMGRWQHSAEVRPGYWVSPKPCRARGAGRCCSGDWAARVADFGDPCKAICPTSSWNEGQLARFWGSPLRGAATERRSNGEAQQREISPKSQGYGEAPEFRQNRAGREALESVVAGIGLHGWPISGTRARLYAPQAPGTKVSLHGFGGLRREGAERGIRSVSRR